MDGLDIAGLSADIVSQAMSIAGNAKTTATLHLGKSNTYNPATDTNTPGGGTDVVVQGIQYKSMQVQGTDKSGFQQMFLIEGKDAPTIDEGDTLTIGSKTWNIDSVNTVPGGAAIILGLRK